MCADALRLAFVSSYVPRRCGLATFTADLVDAIEQAGPGTRSLVAAIDDPAAGLGYAPSVRVRIAQGQVESYRAAASALGAGMADLVVLEHEFGLFGVYRDGAYVDHTRAFLDVLRLPTLTTFHTVLPEPEPWMRSVVREIAERSTKVVVMIETAAALLRDAYGIGKKAIVIPHGMPVVVRERRLQARRRLGVTGRAVISTFGLVDPHKGLEYAIEAMGSVAARFPNALYLVIGQTHPEVRRRFGESYRDGLKRAVAESGLEGHVAFVDEYLTQDAIVEYLTASDVYVTPYLDPNQITSGTLAYALGAGKAIVSTPYLHAREALADGRGQLVGFRDARGIAEAITAILGDRGRRREMEEAAYAYSMDATWPAVGRRMLDLAAVTLAEARAAGRAA